MSRWYCHLLVLLVAMVLLVSCTRQRPSSEPPIHLNPNMDSQPKYEAQEKSEFFANGGTMQPPVPGTVARGDFRESDAYYRGMDTRGKWIKSLPVQITPELLLRGQERFNIYCSPCHSRVGDGRGIMIKSGYVPPPSFHDDRLRDLPDGQVFDAISNGIRNMPSYRHQIPVPDRWAIISYLRALQRSQNATIDDVPVELRDKVK